MSQRSCIYENRTQLQKRKEETNNFKINPFDALVSPCFGHVLLGQLKVFPSDQTFSRPCQSAVRDVVKGGRGGGHHYIRGYPANCKNDQNWRPSFLSLGKLRSLWQVRLKPRDNTALSSINVSNTKATGGPYARPCGILRGQTTERH